MSETEDDEFFECPDEDDENAVALGDEGVTNETLNTAHDSNSLQSANGDSCSDLLGSKSAWGGRKSLAAPVLPRKSYNVWSILKPCIGKELSKITMPIVFNEPLSFLQRVVEYMEYGPLINMASNCNDPVQRLEFVTAFAVSATASNWQRNGKPFNPLLGETFEFDRPDLGVRIICEQVSHHPPVSAFHVESALFTFHGSINPKLKFWGKSVEVTPKGTLVLVLKQHNEVYSWQNVNACVHNVIVGKIWLEHYGVMEIVNHTNKYKSVVNYRQCGWFARDAHKVDGFIYDDNKKKMKAFYGMWTDALFSVNVDVWEDSTKSSGSSSSSLPPSKSSSKISVTEPMKDRSSTSEFDSPSATPMKGHMSKTSSEPSMGPVSISESVPDHISSFDLNLSGQKLLWKVTPKPPNAAQYYSFTELAFILNELNDELKARVAPTDSRLRPDMRKMEEGDIDGAAEEKTRLEELQRSVRKDCKKGKGEPAPLWFKLGIVPTTDKEDWLFTGEYWKRDWTQCPRIF